jgi:biuret amidohydrolase
VSIRNIPGATVKGAPTRPAVAARPYPWPYCGRISPARTALVVVAAQAEVAAICPGSDEALGALESLSRELADIGVAVVATRHLAPPALARPVGLHAADSATPPVFRGDVDLCVDAYGFDGFAGNALEQWLARWRIDHLILGGLWLEGPVHSTMRSANDRGIECLLLEDAVAACIPDITQQSFTMIHLSGGIFGATAPVAELLRSIQASSEK